MRYKQPMELLSPEKITQYVNEIEAEKKKKQRRKRNEKFILLECNRKCGDSFKMLHQ